MKTAIKYLAAIIVMCVFILAGIVGPELIMNYSDKSRIGKVNLHPMELQALKPDSDTLILQKMGLLKQYPERVNKVELEIGTNYDVNTGTNKCLEELSELMRLGLVPEIEQTNRTMIHADVSLYVQKDAPSVNAVLWNILLRRDGFFVNCYMDDETGKIIQFIANSDETFIVKEDAVEKWAEYVGIEAKRIISESKVPNRHKAIYFDVSADKDTLTYVYYVSESSYGFLIQ